MKRYLLLSGAIVLVIIVVALVFPKDSQNKNSKVISTDDVSNSIDSLQNLTDNQIVQAQLGKNKITLEVARSEQKQQEGLMGREAMGWDNGMIFIFENEQSLTFWMKNTLLSLDIIYLDSSLTIVDIIRSAKPNQTEELYPSKSPAQYVIEMNAGWVNNNNIKEGDDLEIL